MRGGFGALAYGIGWIGGFAGGDHDLLTGVSANDHHTEVLEATQAQLEAETASAIYVPPDLVRNSPGVAKAWCMVDANGLLEAPDYNVDSVTDTGLGDRTVVFGTDFSTSVYSPQATNCDTTGASIVVRADTLAVGSVRLIIGNATADRRASLVAFGDQ